MKSLEELHEEVRKNPELVSAFTEAVEKNRLEGFLKEQSCGASLEEAQTFLTEQMGKVQTLSDEELDNVAGGKAEGCMYYCYHCKKWMKGTTDDWMTFTCPTCGSLCSAIG